MSPRERKKDKLPKLGGLKGSIYNPTAGTCVYAGSRPNLCGKKIQIDGKVYEDNRLSYDVLADVQRTCSK